MSRSPSRKTLALMVYSTMFGGGEPTRSSVVLLIACERSRRNASFGRGSHVRVPKMPMLDQLITLRG